VSAASGRATIEVVLNGRAHSVPSAATVAQLVEALGRGGDGLAVAVNAEIVSRSRWPVTVLSAGDRVEILAAAQGG
jgi:sulfur carrier protein